MNVFVVRPLLAVLLAAMAQASTAATSLDQRNDGTQSTSFGQAPSLRWHQGITAGLTGRLEAVEVLFTQESINGSGPPNSGLTDLFIGRGGSSNPALPAFQTTVAVTPGWNRFDVSAANLYLQPGAQFHIGLQAVGDEVTNSWLGFHGTEYFNPLTNPDPFYPGGSLVLNGAPLRPDIGFDMGFRTYVNSSVQPAPHNYGLFVGTRDPGTLLQAETRYDIAASSLASAFSSRPNSTSFVLTGNLTSSSGAPMDPISLDQISEALSEIRGSMRQGDTFTLYIGGHGGPLGSNGQSGDEAVRVGGPLPEEHLSDNWLTEELRLFGDARKTTFIDACHSGGFWGSGDVDETQGIKDLDQLPNTALFAASAEGEVTYYSGLTGIGFFSMALEEAFLDSGASLSAGDLAAFLVERSRALAGPERYPLPVFYEAAFGDAVAVDPSLLAVSLAYSSDYDPFAGVLAVPELGTTSLMLMGLGYLLNARRAKRGRVVTP